MATELDPKTKPASEARTPVFDQEIEEYRSLMEEPSEFIDGFGLKTVLGALFVGFIMLPGSIYLGLVTGQSIGDAAQWVTIILFAEVARRSFTTLKKQEVYILFYIAASLVSFSGGVALSGGPFAWFIWNQYLVQSPAFRGMGLADKIPRWVVPPANSPAILHRTFMSHEWIPALLLMIVGQVIGRINLFGLGYVLFRVCSDYERLPFPMAPIGAQGATALAEATSHEETWRWRVFSIGAMIGIVFGAFYVAIPTLSGAVMAKPLQLIPIPWVDLTQNTESFLKATPVGFVTNLGTILVGFVLPFWVVVGGFIAAALTLVINPVLYHYHILHRWRPGMDTIQTTFVNSIDFWLSVGIGVSLAVAVIGIYEITRSLIRAHRERKNKEVSPREIPPGRGDIPIYVALGIFIVTSFFYIYLCHYLVPRFPVWFFYFFAFGFTPVNSYIHARMTGLTGQYAGIPMVKEGTIILSGYKGIDIWFAPLPYGDYGGQSQQFRVLELTGTKFTSIMKAEVLMLPIILFTSWLFWGFMWKLAPIPSNAYPYAQKMWHLFALNQGLWMTSTAEGKSVFRDAINFHYIAGGLIFGLTFYAILALLGLPILLIYGFIRGMGSMPHAIFPEIVGALLGRYYFQKRFGTKVWRLYATVLLAGFSCGMGLIGMGCVAIAMISKSVTQMPF